MNIEVVHPAAAELAEGAFWAWREQELLWVDILGRTVNRFDPVSRENRSVTLASLVGTVVPRSDGDLHVAVQEGFARLDRRSGQLTGLAVPADHDASSARFNDGKCDPAGRFLAGTTSLAGAPRGGALYVLDADGTTHRLLDAVSLSNGLAWSVDGRTLYYIDTFTRRVDAFDYDIATASLSNRRIAVEIPAHLGYPDGMTIDAEGLLWVALWGGSAIIRCDPRRGAVVQRITLPVSLVTSCAFGGEKLDTLYVTSARCDLSAAELAEQPLAGSLFALDPGTAGCKAAYFEAPPTPPPETSPVS